MKARNHARMALGVFALAIMVNQTNGLAQPTLLVANCPGDKTVDCSSAWSFDQPTGSTTCGITNITINVEFVFTNNACPLRITRTWLLEDACGNIATCFQTVTLTNPAPLVLICPSNKTVNCSSPVLFDTPAVTGGCGGILADVTLVVLSEVVTGVCPQVITRTWLVTDPCGDSNTCSQSITTVNTTPPSFGPSSGQNLVPNPGFESYSSCPDNYSEIVRAVPWFQPTVGTPDLFNVCASALSQVSVPANFAGSQAAHGGEGYAGEVVFDGGSSDYREYIEAPLQNRLLLGRNYEVSFYVSLGEEFFYAVGDLGAYFSIGPAENNSINVALPFTPQVQNPPGNFLSSKTDWMLVQGSFTAVGGEDHLTIGNFSDDQHTPNVNVAGGASPYAFYYIDDVTVQELGVPCPTNKTVHCGDVWDFDGPPTAFDACSGTNVPVTVESTVTTGTCPQLVTRTWLAVDACGNSNTCSQTVTVLDAPVILCPSNIVVTSCTNIGVEYSATVTGTCCTNVTVVYTPPSGSLFAPGTVTNVHCVVTDCCSNSTSCDFTVTVKEAGFNVTPMYGASPLTVAFTFQSPCPTNIFNWHLNFGDSETTNFTTEMLVSHIYSNTGTYTPILVTTGTGSLLSTNVLTSPIVVVSPFTAWQINYFNCTNCLVAAPDADPFGKGISNTNQFLVGLDPTNPASVFKIVSMARSSNDVVITWKTAGVRTNAVQATAGGANGSYNTNGFVDIGSPIVIGATGDATAFYTDTGAATNTPSRYYRVRLVP